MMNNTAENTFCSQNTDMYVERRKVGIEIKQFDEGNLAR
jgi:hypothetical protein